MKTHSINYYSIRIIEYSQRRVTSSPLFFNFIFLIFHLFFNLRTGFSIRYSVLSIGRFVVDCCEPCSFSGKYVLPAPVNPSVWEHPSKVRGRVFTSRRVCNDSDKSNINCPYLTTSYLSDRGRYAVNVQAKRSLCPRKISQQLAHRSPRGVFAFPTPSGFSWHSRILSYTMLERLCRQKSTQMNFRCFYV